MARKVKKVKEVDGVGGAGTAGEPNARVVMTEARRVVPPRVAHRCAEMARRAMVNFERASATLATADLADRAHSVRGIVRGRVYGYQPAGKVMGASPRRYPRGYMHEVVVGEWKEEPKQVLSAGCCVLSPQHSALSTQHSLRLVERAVAVVSDETVFDETFRMERVLRGLGLEVGGRRGVEPLMCLDEMRLRDLVRREVRVVMTAEEVALEAAGDEILAGGGGAGC